MLKNLWWVSFVIALILLADHSFKTGFFNIDSISILLLVVMLLSPFITAIKKIKYGDFEAEIDIEEIRKIKSEAEKTLSESQGSREDVPEIYATSDAIRSLAETDPVIALAKIRIELEKVLGQLSRFSSIKTKGIAIGVIINNLANQEILRPDVGKSLREVIAVCNRAIHGEAISAEGSKVIIDVGVELLEELYWLARDQTVVGTIVDKQVITTDEVNAYYHKKRYLLTSVIPYVERPQKIVREVIQEQLDKFLDNYCECAEFIVDLREIENDEG